MKVQSVMDHLGDMNYQQCLGVPCCTCVMAAVIVQFSTDKLAEYFTLRSFVFSTLSTVG